MLRGFFVFDTQCRVLAHNCMKPRRTKNLCVLVGRWYCIIMRESRLGGIKSGSCHILYPPEADNLCWEAFLFFGPLSIFRKRIFGMPNSFADACVQHANNQYFNIQFSKKCSLSNNDIQRNFQYSISIFNSHVQSHYSSSVSNIYSCFLCSGSVRLRHRMCEG